MHMESNIADWQPCIAGVVVTRLFLDRLAAAAAAAAPRLNPGRHGGAARGSAGDVFSPVSYQTKQQDNI